jgi:hypothetical protein|tara:strand:+ start:4626 stop:5216 length:591 start_codon:yes stop_codon:yes gene_type:complete
MNMRILNSFFRVASFALITAFVPQVAIASSGHYPNKLEITYDTWPEGMTALVNLPKRIHGYYVNAADVFFFTGNQKLFNEMLLKYSKIDGIVEHKIVIHEGRGRAKSPWQKIEGLPCDWMIYGCPASWAWLDSRAEGEKKPEGHLIEIHIWKEGSIKIDHGRLLKKIAIEIVKAEGGADQPASAPESKLEGKQQPK